jgi:hypothetical protein
MKHLIKYELFEKTDEVCPNCGTPLKLGNECPFCKKDSKSKKTKKTDKPVNESFLFIGSIFLGLFLRGIYKNTIGSKERKFLKAVYNHVECYANQGKDFKIEESEDKIIISFTDPSSQNFKVIIDKETKKLKSNIVDPGIEIQLKDSDFEYFYKRIFQ